MAALEADRKAALAQGIMEPGPSQAYFARVTLLLKAWTGLKNLGLTVTNSVLYLFGRQGSEYYTAGKEGS